MAAQILYVDYEGGQYVSWFYSEGDRHKGKSSHDYSDILSYKRRNDFTDVVITNEARLMLRIPIYKSKS